MKVTVVAQQRTGSTFLSRCLDSHSQVWSPSIELYYRRSWRAFLFGVCQSADVLSGFHDEGQIRYDLMRELPRDQELHTDEDTEERLTPIRVAKIMHNQMLTTPRLERHIIKNTDIRVIHLRRENLLKQHVSNMLNKQREARRRPAHTTEPMSVSTIRINPRHAMYRMRMAKMLFQWYDRRLSRHQRINVVYEQIVAPNGLSESATERLCEFLGVPLEPMVADLVKLNPDDLRTIVTNYDEVSCALTGTEFEQYLE